MSPAGRAAVLLATAASHAALAAGIDTEGGVAKDASAPAWSLGLVVYPTDVRGGENYTSTILVADRGSLHLEARFNYESVGARSAYLGWTFTGGETLTWEITPLLGGAWGTTEALVVGAEASVTWKRFDLYVEAEVLRPHGQSDDSYLYSWNELGFRPAEWLRLGIVGQRTRSYDNQRDIQRGPFVQLTWKRLTVGAYWFNPGSSEQVLVGSVGVTF